MSDLSHVSKNIINIFLYSESVGPHWLTNHRWGRMKLTKKEAHFDIFTSKNFNFGTFKTFWLVSQTKYLTRGQVMNFKPNLEQFYIVASHWWALLTNHNSSFLGWLLREFQKEKILMEHRLESSRFFTPMLIGQDISKVMWHSKV